MYLIMVVFITIIELIKVRLYAKLEIRWLQLLIIFTSSSFLSKKKFWAKNNTKNNKLY